MKATIPVGSEPSGVAVTPDGSRVYVANVTSNSVSVIATASNTVAATIPVGSFPTGVAVTPDGSTVYVANLFDNTVSVIATASNTVATTIAVGDFPTGVAVTPDGSAVYVVNSLDGSVSRERLRSCRIAPFERSEFGLCRNDPNPCTVTSPCLTFAAALTNTTAGGEIDVLTPGDYGPVTITKAISIYDDGAGTAGALTTSGTSGITINAGANDAVNLRGLSFNGLTASGASGVNFISGARLHIEKCSFQSFATSGITFAPGGGSAATVAMVIEDTTLINNTVGLSIRPTGGIAANVALRRIKLDKNIIDGRNCRDFASLRA